MREYLTRVILLCLAFDSYAFASDGPAAPKFSDYPVALYSGHLRIPSYYVGTGDVWRDDMGKEVAPPKVNFAGKYYIGLHSCGAECRYYTLSDLSSGRDSNALDMFSSDAEKPTKTKDGRTYITDLIGRSDSKMVVAQYHIDQSDRHPSECRGRIFVLSEDGRSVTPITGTTSGCEAR